MSASVPAVKVVVLVADSVNSSPSDTVIPVPLIVNAPNVVLVLLVMVPDATIVAVKLLNVPPLDNVKLSKFNAVVPGLNAVVPKFNTPNQLPVVNVCTAVPLPVNDKLGEFADVPPVVPNTYVLVTAASDVNPPVPV